MGLSKKAMEELCSIYYDKDKFKHAKRVAEHTKTLKDIFRFKEENAQEYIYLLGLAHDLYEDTDIQRGAWFDEMFEENLLLLTKEKDVDYIEYIKNIRKQVDLYPTYIPAYIVKLADIWDHLNQDKTLTKKRKEKYIKALPYLL